MSILSTGVFGGFRCAVSAPECGGGGTPPGQPARRRRSCCFQTITRLRDLVFPCPYSAPASSAASAAPSRLRSVAAAGRRRASRRDAGAPVASKPSRASAILSFHVHAQHRRLRRLPLRRLGSGVWRRRDAAGPAGEMPALLLLPNHHAPPRSCLSMSMLSTGV